MRLINLGLISIVVFGAMIYIFSLFIPSSVRISRAINIGLPKDTLSRYIADMRTWPHWNDMVKQQDSVLGTFAERNYKGATLSIDILTATSDSIRARWQSGTSEPVLSGFNLVQSLSDTTVAQWYFDFQLKWYPWEKFGSIVFDQQLGPAMETSLDNLRKNLEHSSYQP